MAASDTARVDKLPEGTLVGTVTDKAAIVRDFDIIAVDRDAGQDCRAMCRQIKLGFGLIGLFHEGP